MKFINYLFEKANGVIIFFTMGTVTALICTAIMYSLIVTDPSSKLTTSSIPAFSLIFGVFGGLLFLTMISHSRRSDKFWDYAKTVERQINAADSKELLECISKDEFETLRELCMGGPQIAELNRLYTIIKTKYKYVP